MKKIMYLAASAAAMFLVSCSMEIEETTAPDFNGKTVIGATIDNACEKTSLGEVNEGKYPVLWSVNDQIAVNGIVSDPLAASSITDGTRAIFTFDETIEGEYKAVYPASALQGGNIVLPSVQAYKAGNCCPASAVMVGKGSGNSIAFTTAVAYLDIKIEEATDITTVTVSSLGSEIMSGKFSTDYASLTPVSGSNSVSVLFDAPTDAGEIIVAIPAQTYANGIQVTFQDKNGKIMSKKSEKSFTAAAGSIYPAEFSWSPAVAEATITIDGSISDWKNAELVRYMLPNGYARFTSLRELCLTSDDDNVYMLLTIDETDSQFGNSFAQIVDIFVDKDGDTATGGYLTSTDNTNVDLPYTASGLEWYIEPGAIHNGEGGYIDFTYGAYKFTGADGTSIWSLANQTGNYGADEMYAKGYADSANNLGYVEIKMSRTYFDIAGEKAAFGAKLMDGNNNWDCIGLLPQATGSDAHHGAADMAVLALNAAGGPAPAEAIAFTTTPEDAAAISIDHSKGLYDEALALAWSANILGASYTVNMSLAEDMTSPVAVYNGTSASLKLDNRTLNNIMYKLGKAYTKDVVVYYQVAADGDAVAPSAVKNVKVSTEFSSLDDPRDGEFYTVTKVNGAEWLAENLRATKYSDGSAMPTGELDLACFFYEAGAYGKKAGAYYGYGNALGVHYNTASTRNGNLVTAEEKIQGVCPSGWHVPNQNDWMNLMNTAFSLAGATISTNFFSNATGAYGRAAFQKMVLRADVEDFFAADYLEGNKKGFTNDLGMYFLPVGRYDRANTASNGTVAPTGYGVSFASWNSTMNGGIWKAYSPFIKYGDGQYYTINQNIHWTCGAAETLRCVKD